MKRLFARLDSGRLAALALATVAAWPLLTRPSLPVMTDAEMHVYRAAEIADSLRAGVLYPRWAPDFYFGHGYPVFNYYSPLAYHVAAWYGLTTGLGPVAGTKFVLVLSVYLGALGMYLFVRQRWGAAQAVVASAAFAFAPYILYIDPHARGDVPEVLAVALTPALLMAMDRVGFGASGRRVALAALLLAALLLSHPLMAIVMVGLLVMWLVWDHFIVPLTPTRYSLVPIHQKLIPQLTALWLGVALAGFYWIPVLFERGAVQLHNVAGPGYFDFHKYFVGVGELFAPSPIFDLGASEPAFRLNLGLAQWALAGLGTLALFVPRLRRTDLLFFAFAAVAFLYLITPGSVAVWEAIPALSLFQFPTRFLGPAAVAFAVLAGAAVRWGDYLPEKARWSPPLLAMATCFAAALPLMYPPLWGEFGAVTPQRMIGVELAGRALGTTSANDFLPVAVTRIPGPQPGMLESYDRGLVDKINYAVLPPGATARVLEHGPTHDAFELDTPDRFVFRIYTFYFPGWRVVVDGEPVPIDIAYPEGLITFWVPAGQHRIEVEFADTPPRTFGWIVSALGLLGLALAAIFWGLSTAPRPDIIPAAPMSPALRVALLAALPLIAAFKWTADGAGWFRVTSTGDAVLGVPNPLVADLGFGIHFLGYDLPQAVVRPGDAVSVTVYWKTSEPVDTNYQVFIHLIGPDGGLWGQSDKLNPADFPTSRWPTDKYIRDEHSARLRSDAPPGLYTIVAGLWDAATGKRLYAVDSSGQLLGDGVPLPTLLYVRP